MLRIECSPRVDRRDSRALVRAIGVLRGPLLNLLVEKVERGNVVLDLSQVQEADADAVRMLARLPPDQCELIDCPNWLALWIQQERGQ